MEFLLKQKTQTNKDDGWWIAEWSGDPGRTTVENNAKRYKSELGAKIARGIIKFRYSHVRKIDLEIVPVSVTLDDVSNAIENKYEYDSVESLIHIINQAIEVPKATGQVVEDKTPIIDTLDLNIKSNENIDQYFTKEDLETIGIQK